MTTARPIAALTAIVYTLPIGSLFLKEQSDGDDDGDDVHFVCNNVGEVLPMRCEAQRENKRVRVSAVAVDV